MNDLTNDKADLASLASIFGAEEASATKEHRDDVLEIVEGQENDCDQHWDNQDIIGCVVADGEATDEGRVTLNIEVVEAVEHHEGSDQCKEKHDKVANGTRWDTLAIEYHLLDTAEVLRLVSRSLETGQLPQPVNHQSGHEESACKFGRCETHETGRVDVNGVPGVIEEEKECDKWQRSLLLVSQLSLEVGRDSAAKLGAIGAEDQHRKTGEKGAAVQLVQSELRIDIRDMKVDWDVIHGGEVLVWKHLHSHIIHFVIDLLNETDREVSADLSIEVVTVESIALIGLIFVKIVPFFIVGVFATHLHTILHIQLLIDPLVLPRLPLRNEPIDQNFLIQLLHVFNASEPDWRVAILVEWLALHRIIK